MAVFSVEGRFGSGKTAFAVWFARELATRRGGVPVYANFHIVGSNPIYSFEELYDCEDAVIVLDELQGTIHARRSNHNLEFLAWFDQCRKQNSDVICITQALHKVDVIVREMIDIDFDCENRGDNITAIVAYDLHKGVKKASRSFDRSVSYELYNTRERAWALKPAAELAPKQLSTKRQVRRVAMGP